MFDRNSSGLPRCTAAGPRSGRLLILASLGAMRPLHLQRAFLSSLECTNIYAVEWAILSSSLLGLSY